MSNLIDKQAAIESVGLNTWAGSRISQLPTVEAIPIDWMKRWYSNRGWMHNYEFERMLNDWEKENE